MYKTNYIKATLLDPRSETHFLTPQRYSELAVQTLIAACRIKLTLVLNEQDNTQLYLAQLQAHNCDISEQPSTTDSSSPPFNKKRFGIHDSYKKAKKLASASST